MANTSPRSSGLVSLTGTSIQKSARPCAALQSGFAWRRRALRRSLSRTPRLRRPEDVTRIGSRRCPGSSPRHIVPVPWSGSNDGGGVGARCQRRVHGSLSGLFAMLNLVMHPMLAAMNGHDFARFLRAFLPTARHAPFNYGAVIGMVVAPIVALVALGDDPSATPFVLTAIGLARSPSPGRCWCPTGSRSRTTT